MADLRVRKRHSFSSVDDLLLEATWLSFAARIVLAWALGRPNGWVIQIAYMTATLGLTDKTWPRVRKELIARGYFVQHRYKGNGGRFEWVNEITDDPLYQSIPPKRRDGESRDANGRDAKGGDITEGDKQNHQNRERGFTAPGADADLLSLKGDYTLDTETGIQYQAGNAEDAKALADIKRHSPTQISAAVKLAASLDPRGRAWPSATWKILSRGKAGGSGPPAWATIDDSSAVGAAEEIEGWCEGVED